MVQSLEISGFRGFRKLSLHNLAPVTIFTGLNGAGKTTALEAALAIYGRRNPAWVPGLQGHRGFNVMTAKGPNYTGLFYGFSDTGKASIVAKFTDGKIRRLDVQRFGKPQARSAPPSASSSTEETASSQLNFRAYEGKQSEHSSRLIWEFSQSKRPSLRAEGAPAEAMPVGMLMHPSDRAAGAEERERFGQLALGGRMTRLWGLCGCSTIESLESNSSLLRRASSSSWSVRESSSH